MKNILMMILCGAAVLASGCSTAPEPDLATLQGLICERLGIQNPSAKYLSEYLNAYDEVPDISLDAVLKAAGYIEAMCRRQLKARMRHPGQRASRGVRVE